MDKELPRMNSGSEHGFGLLAAGLEDQPVREQFAPDLFEDTTLVSAARDGDRAAFGRLYDRYARMVHGVLLAKVPLGEVDDLVQDVFVLALRRLSTLREVGSFGAWLAAIARNLAMDYHRRAAPEDQLTADLSENDTEHPMTNGEHEGAAAAILEAIRSLPEAYREPLILRLVEGMTGPEIATRTGLTPGSVRVNLHRGMQQLRERLGPSSSSSNPEQKRP
jgi:RNA polymerase sigma-70 factor (ECF subfamily)